MDQLRIRARAAGGWLACAALIALCGAGPVTAARPPKISLVRVVNDIGGPALTQDVATAEPVSVATGAGFDGNIEASADFPYTVPDNRRLIVRQVSIAGLVPIGQKLVAGLGPQDSFSAMFIPLTSQGTFNSGDVFIGGGPSYLVFEPGATPKLLVSRNSAAGQGVVNARIQGTLVPLVAQ
jgi:hypothetical protein